MSSAALLAFHEEGTESQPLTYDVAFGVDEFISWT